MTERERERERMMRMIPQIEIFRKFCLITSEDHYFPKKKNQDNGIHHIFILKCSFKVLFQFWWAVAGKGDRRVNMVKKIYKHISEYKNDTC
jgi:hypothetical protein